MFWMEYFIWKTARQHHVKTIVASSISTVTQCSTFLIVYMIFVSQQRNRRLKNNNFHTRKYCGPLILPSSKFTPISITIRHIYKHLISLSTRLEQRHLVKSLELVEVDPIAPAVRAKAN